MSKKRCFVVMGFGIKTDLATGRKLNLDKSYNALIKPVVEGKNMDCVRADEIRHSGAIDVPMYQELLNADVVVADISTANPNAFYELGIRHALRPHTTIVISESELNYPFDLNHILINKYTHLGDSIDYFEVLRFQKLLGETLDKVLSTEEVDSPIYTFLNDLVPPSLQKEAQKVAKKVNIAIKEGRKEKAKQPANQTMAVVIKQAEEALVANQFSLAKNLFKSAMLMSGNHVVQNDSTTDSYLVHRCAFATYKAKEPDELTALKEATQILSQLDLAHTNDSETVILAGKFEKRLYFNDQGEQHLANAIQFFERGFFLLNNRFNSINLAFLFNVRAASNLYHTKEDKIADVVFGNRVRRAVLAMCVKDWNMIVEKSLPLSNGLQPADKQMMATQKDVDEQQKFWIMVNKAEAHFGLGEMKEYKEALDTARLIEHQDWMMKKFNDQLQTLRGLLQQQSKLMNPEWKED